MHGRVLYQNDVLASKHTIELSDYATGTYFVHLSKKEHIQIKKLIIKK